MAWTNLKETPKLLRLNFRHADVEGVIVYGGEVQETAPGELRVVEADQRHVARDFVSGFAQRGARPQCHGVVGRENRGQPRMFPQQLHGSQILVNIFDGYELKEADFGNSECK